MTKHQTKKFIISGIKINECCIDIDTEDWNQTKHTLTVFQKGEDIDNGYTAMTVHADAVPFCCGVEEIGDVEILGGVFNDFKKGTDLLVIAYFFIWLHEEAKKGTSRRGLIFNSNSVGDCAVIDKALALIPAYWQCVSKTTNPRGGNRIKMWVAIP